MRVELRVHVRAERQCPGEGVVGHHEHAQDGVDDGQDDNQRVEAVPHLLPETGRLKLQFPAIKLDTLTCGHSTIVPLASTRRVLLNFARLCPLYLLALLSINPSNIEIKGGGEVRDSYPGLLGE